MSYNLQFINVAVYITTFTEANAVTVVITYYVLLIKALKATATLTF